MNLQQYKCKYWKPQFNYWHSSSKAVTASNWIMVWNICTCTGACSLQFTVVASYQQSLVTTHMSSCQQQAKLEKQLRWWGKNTLIYSSQSPNLIDYTNRTSDSCTLNAWNSSDHWWYLGFIHGASDSVEPATFFAREPYISCAACTHNTISLHLP